MTETPQEWVEMAWAARDASHAAMNDQGRAWFGRVKALILERDLPRSIVHQHANVIRLAKAR
jgi:hypothetical protein